MVVKFDPTKALANLKKHGISFADATGVLSDPLAVTIEDIHAQGENRFVSIGAGSAGEILVVVYAEREGTYRLISARRASSKERKDYEG